MKTSSLHRQSGLNLIEILVAALILSVGLLSMAGLQVASLKSSQNATQKQQVATMAHELLERMRSNRAAALAGNYSGTFTAGTDCSSATPPDCTGATACSPTQLAAFDLNSILCGSASATVTRSGMNDQLLNGVLAITCPSGDCGGGISVRMDWSERLVSDDVLENDDGSATNGESQAYSVVVNAVI